MPQLEIHHADGSVTYAELTQSKPLMIGSGTNCDVVLSDPAIKRVHCRLVWRRDRNEYRVEVAADAGGVQLGGKTVKAGTVRAGDIIGLGNSRIYVDEGAATQAPPPAAGPDLDYDASASLEEAATEERHVTPSTIRKASHLRDQRGIWRKVLDALGRKAKEQFRGESDRPPGQERILGSPLIRWMLVGVLVIGVLGVIFFYDYRNRQIAGLYEKAQKTMNEGNWDGAIRLFENFLKDYPTHSLASSAIVQRGLCEVESNASASPIAALADARRMIRELGKEPGFEPLIPRITETMGRVAQNLADLAQAKSDRKLLEQSQDALEVINRDLKGAKLTSEAQAKLVATMELAEKSIIKYEELVATMSAMDQAIQAGNTREAYARRERLIQLYDDLKDKSEIVDRMTQANKLDQEAVRWEAMNKSAEKEPRAGSVAASTLLLDRRVVSPATGGAGNVQFALAGGAISAHDGNTGEMLWSMVVGRDASLLPAPIPVSGAAEPVVILADVRHDELVAVQAKTGKLVWRQALGEPIACSPLLNRGKLYQPTGKGSLFVIDPSTGRLDGRLKLSEQRLSTTPAADSTGTRLYLLGESYLLYIITLGGVPKCDAVYYTAHRPDSIFAAPLRLNRYLVLFENQTATAVVIRVFLLSADGSAVEEIQNIPRKGDPPISGWVHAQPAVHGNLMFVATDLENVLVYSGGPPEKADGFSPVKSVGGGTPLPGTRPQAYTMMFTDKDLLVAGSKLRHYLFAAEQQTLTPTKELLPGAVSQPIQRFPATGGRVDLLYVGRKIPGASAVALTALNAADFETRWEVLLGAGVLSLQPTDDTKSTWMALTRAGSVFAVPAAMLAQGGVVDKPVGRLELERELSTTAEPVVLADGSTVFIPAGTPSRLAVRDKNPDSAIRPLELLAPLQTSVVAFDQGILAPGSDGRIYYLSSTGKSLAEPFQPALVSAKPAQWRGVALTTKNTVIALDDQGGLFQVELRKEPSPNLVERAGTKLPRPVRSGVALNGNLVACVDETNVLQVWDAEALSPISEIKLAGPATLGPLAAGNHIFVAVGDDELVCVNSQGQQAWRHPLRGQNVAGKPLIRGDTVAFVTSSGLVRALRLADGSEVWTLDTEKPLFTGPIAIDDSLVVIGDDGSLNVVKAPAGSN